MATSGQCGAGKAGTEGCHERKSPALPGADAREEHAVGRTQAGFDDERQQRETTDSGTKEAGLNACDAAGRQAQHDP